MSDIGPLTRPPVTIEPLEEPEEIPVTTAPEREAVPA
jgi:hypothetical protein